MTIGCASESLLEEILGWSARKRVGVGIMSGDGDDGMILLDHAIIPVP